MLSSLFSSLLLLLARGAVAALVLLFVVVVVVVGKKLESWVGVKQPRAEAMDAMRSVMACALDCVFFLRGGRGKSDAKATTLLFVRSYYEEKVGVVALPRTFLYSTSERGF